jgi:hypothetical protein
MGQSRECEKRICYTGTRTPMYSEMSGTATVPPSNPKKPPQKPLGS